MTASTTSDLRRRVRIFASAPCLVSAPCGRTTATRPVFGCAEVTMCCTHAQSAYPLGGTPPRLFRPHLSDAHSVSPQYFNENGGLATTQSNCARWLPV